MRVEYSDYAEISGRLMPKKIRYFLEGNLVIEGTLEEYVSVDANDSNLFSPLSGATERLWCENMVRARAISTSEPYFPSEMRGHRVDARTRYEVAIDANGHITSISPVTPPSGFDGASIKALKRWKFEPGKCGDTAVPSEMQTEFTFRTYR
jgi:hypothetical protein